MRGGGEGSEAVWNFSENSSGLGEVGIPKGGQMNFDSILPFKRWEASQEGRRGQILSKILKRSCFFVMLKKTAYG